MSKIEWTNATWNPTTGCTKVSAGCKFCYAETHARRLQAMAAKGVPGARGYENGFRFTQHPDRLKKPHAWRKPRMIFVNSMSDLFHPEMQPDFLAAIVETMCRTPQHTYQVLTKRPEAVNLMMTEATGAPGFPPNVWLGTSVENTATKVRIDELRKIPAKTRFLSCEPLLAELGELDLTGIHWVIVGGESGSGARPMRPEWARSVRDQCAAQDVPFFFKQWGAHGEDGVKRRKDLTGRELDGKIHDAFPAT